VEHPYSALRLRLVLALFGLVVCTAGGFLIWQVAAGIAVAFFVLAVIALVDAVVVITRIRRSRSGVT
jgi:hypothetical protein